MSHTDPNTKGHPQVVDFYEINQSVWQHLKNKCKLKVLLYFNGRSVAYLIVIIKVSKKNQYH